MDIYPEDKFRVTNGLETMYLAALSVWPQKDRGSHLDRKSCLQLGRSSHPKKLNGPGQTEEGSMKSSLGLALHLAEERKKETFLRFLSCIAQTTTTGDQSRVYKRDLAEESLVYSMQLVVKSLGPICQEPQLNEDIWPSKEQVRVKSPED